MQTKSAQKKTRLPRKEKKRFIQLFGRNEFHYQKLILMQDQLKLPFWDNATFQKLSEQTKIGWPKKKSVYVLTVSRNFMISHPMAGSPTNFKDQILEEIKIHTMRAGQYWKNIVDRVNSGDALLSLREWSGKPYASKQTEFLRLEKLGWQDVKVIHSAFDGDKGYDKGFWILIDDVVISDFFVNELAKNDGLSVENFTSWFNKDFEGGIIHFTDFRY